MKPESAVHKVIPAMFTHEHLILPGLYHEADSPVNSFDQCSLITSPDLYSHVDIASPDWYSNVDIASPDLYSHVDIASSGLYSHVDIVSPGNLTVRAGFRENQFITCCRIEPPFRCYQVRRLRYNNNNFPSYA